MHASDLLAMNVSSYWARLDSSMRCFDAGPSLAEGVIIVDVPAIPTTQSNNPMPLRQQECADLKSLEEHLGDPANVSYSCRFMYVIVKWQGELRAHLGQINMPERLVVKIADNETDVEEAYRAP